MSETNFCVGSALTAQGSVDFWESNLSRVSRALILQSLPGVPLPEVLRDFEEVLAERGLPAESYLRAHGKAELACLVVHSNLAILDSSLLGAARLPGEAERIVLQAEIESRWDGDERGMLNQLHAQACRAACRSLQKALQIHDEWEAYHIRVLNRERSREIIQELSEEFFPMQLQEKPRVRHRFLGAATAQGPLDCIQSVTRSIPNRIFLKGRPGTGKSTMLKKLAAIAGRHGLDHDLYHCSFDSHSLDMLIVPQADVCLMDATDPHSYAPEREGDRMIDLYDELVPEGTDEANAEALAEIQCRYEAAVAESRRHMRGAADLVETFRGGIDVHWTRADTLSALKLLLAK